MEFKSDEYLDKQIDDALAHADKTIKDLDAFIKIMDPLIIVSCILFIGGLICFAIYIIYSTITNTGA